MDPSARQDRGDRAGLPRSASEAAQTRSSGSDAASTGPLLPPLSAVGNCSAGGDYTDISGNAG